MVKELITLLAFLFTVLMILWRPRGLNIVISAAVGAALVLLSGSVSFTDLWYIFETVGGASITIIATIVMAVVMESLGVFHWMAGLIKARAGNSGLRLFWYVNLLCFLMTVFFNNDGSILITTPVLLFLLDHYGLENSHKVPYLLSGALTATAASALVGASNIVNLISMKIVGINLYIYTIMMSIPTAFSLFILILLLFFRFYKDLPSEINTTNSIPAPEQSCMPGISGKIGKLNTRVIVFTMLFALVGRVMLFVASYFEVPIELVAVLCSLLLLGWRWYHLGKAPVDLIKSTPWHIFGFAFSMYVIVCGLHNIGLTDTLRHTLQPVVSGSLLQSILLMGTLLTLLSNIFNNHPAMMVGTLLSTSMSLDPLALKAIYLANIIGSDIGCLLLPTGSLATLIWLHMLKQNGIIINWKKYISVTVLVIPAALIIALLNLGLWIYLVYQ
ncbi:MAG: ArsB/NhaD family transporter [Desulfotomaculaceae bacterium]|nr:ArsB/NhaD family transporter [Desulfotomaculaceae bacterium]